MTTGVHRWIFPRWQSAVLFEYKHVRTCIQVVMQYSREFALNNELKSCLILVLHFNLGIQTIYHLISSFKLFQKWFAVNLSSRHSQMDLLFFSENKHKKVQLPWKQCWQLMFWDTLKIFIQVLYPIVPGEAFKQ